MLMFKETTKSLRRLIRRTLDKKVIGDFQRIRMLVEDPELSRSYYPEQPRKTKSEIYSDLARWYVKHGEVNEYYFVYGFDRKQVNEDEYFAWPDFRAVRNGSNRGPGIGPYNYICMLQDKFVFSQFLASLNVPTPRAIAVCSPDGLTWLDDMSHGPIERILQDGNRHFDGFCKKLNGMNGRGAFPLRVCNGQMFIGSERVTAERVQQQIEGWYLIQERIAQHPTMSSLHPHSINTMRILTFNQGGRIEVFSAAQRMGTNGRSVDNWTAGGILVAIDLETGRMRADGFYKPGYGGKVQQHPQTMVKFDGFEIPCFREAIESVKNVHRYFYGVHSIGWDVAISPSGPVIIEGNDDWDGAVPMALERDFKRRLLAMYA